MAHQVESKLFEIFFEITVINSFILLAIKGYIDVIFYDYKSFYVAHVDSILYPELASEA